MKSVFGLLLLVLSGIAVASSSAATVARTYTHLRNSGKETKSRSLVGKADLTKAKDLLIKVLDLIYNRYELYDNEVSGFFYAVQTFNAHSWDIWKYRFAKKIIKGDDSYIMTFGGSSVTAGHDNQRNSSYPGIVEKRLKDIFEAAGVDFRVHNIAQGANGCWPYELLYETMGEIDPDFVGWEQSYNCGHDMPSFTATTRVAGMSKARGSVYFTASGAWLPNDHNESEFSPPYCAEEWTVDSVQAPHTPLKHWTPTADDVAAQKAKMDEFDKAKHSYQRFFPAAYATALAPSGFNVWEGNPKATAKFKDGRTKTGVNAADAGIPKDTAVRFFSKEAARFDNPRGGGARHHPSKAFHMWRGEEIVWLHALTMLDAIFMIEKDLQAGQKKEELYKTYAAAMDSLQGPLPDAPAPGTSCNAQGRHCQYRSIAYTDYSHLAQLNRTLTGIIVGKSDWLEDAALYPNEVAGPNFATERFQLERKPAYHNEGKNGELYLKIVTGVTEWVLLCGQRKESLKHTTMTFDLHGAEDESKDLSEYSFTNRLRTGKDVEPLVEWKYRHYIGSECTELSKVPPGKHILGISRNETEVKGHVNSLIHVVVW